MSIHCVSVYQIGTPTASHAFYKFWKASGHFIPWESNTPSSAMSNVVIYGGAGALGRHLVSKFTSNNWVTILTWPSPFWISLYWSSYSRPWPALIWSRTTMQSTMCFWTLMIRLKSSPRPPLQVSVRLWEQKRQPLSCVLLVVGLVVTPKAQVKEQKGQCAKRCTRTMRWDHDVDMANSLIDFIKNSDLMVKQSVNSSLIAANVAAHHLAE